MNRILMVDNQEKFVKTIQDRLAPSGFEIFTAQDGNHGFQLAKDKTPDLIIADSLIPIMSAFEFCKAIKLEEMTKSIPIIVLTEKNRMEEAFMYLGIKDFLHKPINVDELELAVKAKLRWSQMMKNQKTKILISGNNDVLSSCQGLIETMPQWSAYYAFNHVMLLKDAIKYVPDVIFIDLLMPELAADEMIKKLKEVPDLRNTVILTYYNPSSTARDHFAIRAQMIAVQYMKIVTEQAGAKEYLGPYNPNLFLDLINMYRKDFAV